MTQQEIQEQLQQDILSILEGFGIEEIMKNQDYEKMKDVICNAIISHINKISDADIRNTRT